MNPENRKRVIKDVSLVVIFGLLYVFSLCLPPRYTTVLEGDMSISRPVSNTINSISLALVIAISAIVILLWYIFTEKKSKWSVYDAVIFIALSFLMTASLTQFIKVYVGRPRPAFFSICQYPKVKIGDMEMYGVPGRVADISKCTASKHKIDDAFMSFPSGHSSYSMCAGLFLYLLILRCLNEVKWMKASVMQMIKALTLIVCLAIPVIVGGSRIFDYKHSEGDVLAGFLVGVVSTLAAYYMVFGTTFSRYESEMTTSSPTNV